MEKKPETPDLVNFSQSSYESDSPASPGLFRSERVIAALASGGQRAAIGVIRISGPECANLVRPCLTGFSTDSKKFRKMQLTRLIDPKTHDVIDEPLVVFFRAPHSFTGEDSIEIFCHGGPFIIRRILEVLHGQGISLAEPGEFTKRAFLHGKLDLTEAEGIRELVEAHSEQQWRAARYMAEGRLASYIGQLRQSLIEAMAYLEARIDFPDEGDTQSVEIEGVAQRVRVVDGHLARLSSTYRNGRIARTGLKVAIIGAPNMGKSTLMNELLGRDRAIVTDIAGTTRDYLEETCLIDGRAVCLIDTAGLRETLDHVEKIGVDRSFNLSREADLVLLLISASASLKERHEVKKWQEQIGIDKCAVVVTKIDLLIPDWARSFLQISCHNLLGLDQLRDFLAKRVDDSIGRLGEEPFLTSSRHLLSVVEAREALEEFFVGVSAGRYEEMLAFELQNAARSLESIIGRVDHEDVLDQVFGEFCIGK